MPARFSVIPAVYVLLPREVAGARQILLLLRQHTGYMDGFWALPAGHVERYETVFAAACREAREEVGIDIAEADLTPLTAMHRTHPDHDPIDERIDIFFECRRWAGSPRLAEADKAADLRWFNTDALPEPVVSHEKYVIDGYRAGTLPVLSTFGF